ncbi:MAG: protoporphyrinogen oxidase [Pseudomonadota bacterium]
MDAQPKNKVVVIGAGVAGLSAAYYLRKRGVDVEIFERTAHAGGAVRTVLKEERYLLEQGPNAFLASAEPIAMLARELSINPQIVGSDALSRRRYIRARGSMHELPMGPGSFLKSRLLSFRGKLRMFAELMVKTKSAGSESLAQFVARRAGREVLDSLVDPFVSGVWAGDAAQLEVESVCPKLVDIERECGSVLRGMKKLAGGSQKRGLFSFRWGMGTLTARLEEEMKNRLHLETSVRSVERGRGGGFKIRLDGKTLPVEADAVVVAAPAPVAAIMLAELDPDIATPLGAVPYAPLAVVHTAFAEKDIPVPLDGFGVLISRSEKIRLLGSIWSSAIFPSRCPKGEALLTNFIGGATDPGLVDLSDDEITAEVLSGLESTMGIRAKPRRVFVKRTGQSIPQYTVGHGRRLKMIEERLLGLPGIFLTGSYFNGVSVSDTIAHARAEVDRVSAYLKAKR